MCTKSEIKCRKINFQKIVNRKLLRECIYGNVEKYSYKYYCNNGKIEQSECNNIAKYKHNRPVK